jgi:hypothetical protein
MKTRSCLFLTFALAATCGVTWSSFHASAMSTDPAGGLLLGDGLFSPRIGPSPVMAAVEEEKDGAWFDGQVLVATRNGVPLETLAARYGVKIERATGPSGYGAISVPPGIDVESFTHELQSNRMVLDASRMGRIHGAKASAKKPKSLQWYRDAVDTPSSTSHLSDIVVALLDTGVAYENYSDTAHTYKAAASLSGVSFVSPYDFVNDDAHPNDDEQHGTHIATVIAANGEIKGIARGVSLMPLKVLDSENQGDELDLVDGLYYAVDHGADVINMSLAFHPAYTPSTALQEAIRYAHESGVIMVAAAGNDGAPLVAQPAANPLVIAVGAVTPSSKHDFARASYSNYGHKIDVMAPGGDISADLNKDGFADGILGETIDPANPSDLGYWLMAGTSQSAAIVTGAVAHLLARGADPSDVPFILQANANADGLLADRHIPFVDGNGTGLTDVDDARKDASDDYTRPREYVSFVPYLLDDGSGHLVPASRITVFDQAGKLVDGAQILGSILHDTEAWFSCVTEDGVCTAFGLPVDHPTGDAWAAWQFSVEAIVIDGLATRPLSALATGPCFDAAVTALESDPQTAGTMLGFWWNAQTLPELGNIAEAGVLYDSGTGIATSPLTVIFTPPPASLGTFSTASVTVAAPSGSPCELSSVVTYGGGIATSPLTLLPVLSNLPSLLGNGIATSPLTVLPTIPSLPLLGGGIATSPLTVIRLPSTLMYGGSIATSPLTVLPRSLIGMLGQGIATSPLTLLPILPLTPGIGTFTGSGIATSPLTVAPTLPLGRVTGIADGALLMHDADDPIGANTAVGRSVGSTIGAILLGGGWTTLDGGLPASRVAACSMLATDGEEPVELNSTATVAITE